MTPADNPYTVRVALPGERYVVLREPGARTWLRMNELTAGTTAGTTAATALATLPELLDLLDAHAVDNNLGHAVSDLSLKEIPVVIRAWMAGAQAKALDPTTGSGSPVPSRPPRSPRAASSKTSRRATSSTK